MPGSTTGPDVGILISMATSFRRLERSDFPHLSEWLATPHVAAWWRHGYDPASVEADFGAMVDGEDTTEAFIVEEEGRAIGMIQRYRLDEDGAWDRTVAVGTAPRPAAGIDYLIGDESRVGHGLGPRIIDAFARATWERYPELVAIVVAVQQANRQSWRALEKAGFQRDWSGTLESDDPSDAGPSYVYVRFRPSG